MPISSNHNFVTRSWARDGHDAARLQQISSDVSLNGCDAHNVSQTDQFVNIQRDHGNLMPLFALLSFRHAGFAQAGEIGALVQGANVRCQKTINGPQSSETRIAIVGA